MTRRNGIDPAPFWNGTAANILTPLFALGVLALPYLPWVADWIPALRLLAGPGRVLVWVIVLGQVAWLFLPEFTKRRGVKSTVGPFADFARDLRAEPCSVRVVVLAACSHPQ